MGAVPLPVFKAQRPQRPVRTLQGHCQAQAAVTLDDCRWTGLALRQDLGARWANRRTGGSEQNLAATAAPPKGEGGCKGSLGHRVSLRQVPFIAVWCGRSGDGGGALGDEEGKSHSSRAV